MSEIGEVFVKECVIEWTIRDFFSLPPKVDEYYYGPSFSFDGAQWKLKMYPNGQENKSEGHIDLFLVRFSSGPLIELNYSLGLKISNSEIARERHHTFNFKKKMQGDNSASDPVVKSKILEDFKQLLLSQDNCDVVLKVKGQEFQAHKTILTVRSPVFASIFRNDMKEKATGVVDIEDCDPSSFSEFLRFLYFEDVDALSNESVFNLFTAADKYDVSDLREKCIKFIKESLSVDTFCDTITLALRHSETELIRSATDFFQTNADKIIVTVEWQTFTAKNPTESNELIIKLVSSVKH